MSIAALPRAAGVRNALIAIVAMFSLLVFGMIAMRALEAWGDYADARKTQDFNVGANLYVAGAFEVLLERLATNNALQADESATAGVRQEIETRRANARRGFDGGLAILATKEFPGKTEKLREMRAALATANEIRERANAAIQLPKAQRDEALLRDFVPVLTTSVNAALGIWYSALYASASFDATLFRYAAIKELGWRLREVAGVERNTISGAISAGMPLTEAQLARIASVRVRIDQLWSQLESLVADNNVPTAIRDAIAGVHQGYFGDFQRLAEEMLKAGTETARYPMTAAQYAETTTPQLGLLLEIMHAAVKASEAHAADIVGKAMGTLFVLLGILAVVAAIAGAVVHYVLMRILRPLGALTKSVESMAAGNLDLDVPGVSRGDELGTLASAVEIFRKNGLETRRLQAAAAAFEKSEALARETLAKNEKLAALGGLVAGVAHEVNTPLGVAVTAASLQSEALRDIFDAFEKKQLTTKKFEEFFLQSNEVMALVTRNLQRAANLVATFKQVSVDQISDMRRRFLLRQYIDEVVDSLSPTLRGRHIRIETEGDDVEIDGYPGAIGQIATNLVMNALNHGFPGQDAKGSIRIAVAKLGNKSVRITYRDDGVGMNEEVLRKVFDPFFTTKRGLGGTGLGMTIVHNLVVDRLGGTIDIRSQVNDGVKIEIVVPVVSPGPN